MNRNQRKYGRRTMPVTEGTGKTVSTRLDSEFDEVFAPKERSTKITLDERSMTNRCCYVAPDLRDFGHSASRLSATTPSEQYQKILLKQYGFDPVQNENLSHLKELKKILCNSNKVENCSQYSNYNRSPMLSSPYRDNLETTWQNVENIDDIEKYLTQEEKATSPKKLENLPRSVLISDVPRIKVIAQRYSRIKKGDMELRCLDEKIVCVEYDIYDDSSTGDILRPVQKMRVYFSVKPVHGDGESNNTIHPARELPSEFKCKFTISDQDLRKLSAKEIEIIDAKIDENKPYLRDLKHILKRNQVVDKKKKKSTLDLKCLYEEAKKQRPVLDAGYSSANFLSQAELQQMKSLILSQSIPSLHAIDRMKLKSNNVNGSESSYSESIAAVLLRDKMLNL